MENIRGTHSSPGFYSKITDLSYAAKTLGITTLGLVGETKKGPAFEPIAVKDWNEYQDYFGGTDPEKFKDSQYPKYELPYIAKSYLKASDQLYVCRVLGLSGYNAGPAWVIKAKKSGETTEYVIAILRSRGQYQKYANTGDECNPDSKYDQLIFDCDEVSIEKYVSLSQIRNQCTGTTSSETGDFSCNAYDKGKFTIVCKKDNVETRYPVSLNAGAKDYIYNVLGYTPQDGTAKVFVEEFYDYFLDDIIANKGVNLIDSGVTKISEYKVTAIAEPVADFITIPQSNLKAKNLGQTFIYADAYRGEAESGMIEGGLYKVVKSGTSYVYTAMTDDTTAKTPLVVSTISGDNTVNSVKVLAYDGFAYLNDDEVVDFLNNIADYHEQFRCAMTPWIVSELKGNAKENVQVKKLFRFYTISDGNDANKQVKVSISNIKPDDGTFDVEIRDYNDSDGNVKILESYRNCNMVPGDKKYIGLQIGTLDGAYELKSKYVMVEVVENEMTAQCVPAGFLGYPVRNYAGLESPSFAYNKIYDDDIREKRQYFGLSDITGVDEDMFSYKGKNAYTEKYKVGYTHPFHLDSTIGIMSGVTIDGDTSTSGLPWDCVSANNFGTEGKSPIIGSEEEMEGTIYENVKLRKFTVYPYGGFDGWDPYRGARTNGDEFRANKYKGQIKNGYGATFSKIQNGDALGLDTNAITSDYYAYLAGAKQFEIPEKYLINLFATPGIDYVNQNLLSADILEMIEEKRQDTFYVMTTPDKPYGASDAVDDMYTSADAAANLLDSNINSFYVGTYYPWVKFNDTENYQYINLPVTKDVLRNMADVDNKRYPWFAPAGIERGNVECVKQHFFPKLDDEDNVYDGRINPVKTFSKDGVKIWGNKTTYICDETDPMNRINTVRLVLYLRKLINESVRVLVFDPNDTTLADEYDKLVRPILTEVKSERGITDFKFKTSQTAEEMDKHEVNAELYIKPTPTAEYFGLNFIVTPQGIDWE